MLIPHRESRNPKNTAEVHAHLAAKALCKANHECPQDRSADAANDSTFSVSSPGARGAASDKALQTLIAEYALAGYELIDEVGIGGARRLYAIRNGQTQYLDSLDGARAHLERVP